MLPLSQTANYGAILYRLRDIATYWSKIVKFLYPPVYSAPVEILRRRLILVTLRMIRLTCGETMTTY